MVPPSSPEAVGRAESARTLALQGGLFIGGLLALTLLLIALRDTLSPLVLGGAGAILLWPLRNQKGARALFMAGGFVLGVWVLQKAGGVLIPFIVVLILAYLFNPVVTKLEARYGVPRWASALVAALVVVGLLVLLFAVVVPLILGQAQDLASDVITLLLSLPDRLAESEMLIYLQEQGVLSAAEVEQQITTFLPQQIGAMAGAIPETIQQVIGQIGSILGVVTILALIPVLLFYMLKDYTLIRDGLVGMMPRVGGRRTYFTRWVGIVGGYLRGQLIISAIATVVVSTGLALFGVPFSLLIGLLAGFFNLIPNIGAVLTYVVAGLIALIFGDTADVVIALAVVAVQQVLEGSVLVPHIMSQQVGLHPVLVMLSIFVFSAFLGVLGFLVAVPLTAILVSLYKTYKEEFIIDIEVNPAEQRRIVTPGAEPPAPGALAE